VFECFRTRIQHPLRAKSSRPKGIDTLARRTPKAPDHLVRRPELRKGGGVPRPDRATVKALAEFHQANRTWLRQRIGRHPAAGVIETHVCRRKETKPTCSANKLCCAAASAIGKSRGFEPRRSGLTNPRWALFRVHATKTQNDRSI